MNVLVTGGAGFIGREVVKSLVLEGHLPLIVDRNKAPDWALDLPYYQGDICNQIFLESIFSSHKIDAVIHLAAYKDARESSQNMAKYSDNITGTLKILNAMVAHSVFKIIFSSSAAIYGDSDHIPITENHSLSPKNYYGYTKKVGEELLQWFSESSGIMGISLRYFNVVGKGILQPEGVDIFNSIVNVLTGDKSEFMVYGNDYDTRDGTCLRDYVDVNDIARAHVLALNLDTSSKINLGSNRGTTILELLKLFEEVSGRKVPYSIAASRNGEIVRSVASNLKAKQLLGWEPKISLNESIQSLLQGVIL